MDDGSADAALIERWKGGDQRAAAEIVRRHAQALARFAASSGEREELDELVQDTFVRAFNSLDIVSGGQHIPDVAVHDPSAAGARPQARGEAAA